MEVKRATLKDVANKSGFALRTVKKVMGGESVNDATKELVLKAAHELNYKRNNIASALARSRNTKIAIVYSAITKTYFPEVEKGFLSYADTISDFGMAVEFFKCTSKDIQEQETAILQIIEDCTFDGLIIQPLSATKLNPLLERFAESGKPVITFGADALTDKRLCYLGPNAYKAGRIASQIIANYIGKSGNVFMINQVSEHMQTRERMHGFQDRVKEFYPDINVFDVTIPNNSNLYYDIVKATVLNEDIKALFCTDADSYIAGEVLRDLQRKDIVIVGFDLSEPCIDLMREGYIKVIIEQNPAKFSADALNAMFHYLYFDKLPEKIQFSDLSIITSECLND